MGELDDFVNDFLIETKEGLGQLENDLVALEENTQDADRLGSIFRILHTIKGSAGFLEFSTLRDISHSGEHLLGRIRNGEITLSPALSNSLFRLIDAIRELLASIEESGAEGDNSFVELKQQLGAADTKSETKVLAEPTEEKSREISEFQASDESCSDDTITVMAPADHAPDETGEFAQSDSEASGFSRDDITAMDDSKNGGYHSVQQAPEPEPPLVERLTKPPKPPLETSPPKSDSKISGSGSSASSVRVEVDLLNRLMNLVGELVLTRNRILQVTSGQQDPDILNTTQRLNQITSELQDGIMRTRMHPIGGMWQRMPRITRDVSRQCAKKVRLEIEGTETELDKSLIEGLTDPMLHLVRNAIDHGIESPNSRRLSGKPEEGRLTLRAFHEGGQVIIEIDDDGSGLDMDKIKHRAIQLGFISSEESLVMSADELQQSIFLPGFSTADQVSNVSGRGVGMDVVKTNIEQLGGVVSLKSTLGQGTVVRITVPLTLAIIPALVVTRSGDHYTIPQANVVELLRPDSVTFASNVERIHDAFVYRLRGKLLPLVELGNLLEVERPEKTMDESGAAASHLIVLRAGERHFALMVDRIIGTQEIVVKPLGVALETIGIYTGSTIMGDGSVSLILDVLGLGRRAGLFTRDEQEVIGEPESMADETLVVVERLLICEVGLNRRIGISIRSLTCVEHVARADIEYSVDEEVVQYRGGIMPLIRLSHFLMDESETNDSDSLYVVVHTAGDRHVGIVVDRVLDITDTPSGIERSADGNSPITGTAIVQDRVTDMIDPDRLIRIAGLFLPTTVGAEASQEN
ncbi:MAG: chemotaxis protein CheA [Fuerstiella sp.]